MAKPIDLGMIQARRKKIADDLREENERHRRIIDALQKESEELAVAERVFSRLSVGDGTAVTGQQTPKATSSGKPEGLPPMPEMIKAALAHAVRMDIDGMKPAAILSYIRGRWWSDAEANDVGPIAWRMWQNKQIDKYQNGEYVLTDKDIAAIRAEIDAEKKAAESQPMRR